MTNDVATITRDTLPTSALSDAAFGNLPLSLRVITDKGVYQQVHAVAKHMANSPGLVGQHLIGNVDACFSIILLSIDFKLNPYMVAKCTFSAGKVMNAARQWVPGNIGFEGKLVTAIVNASGRCSKPPEIEYFGDWDKVLGKFEMREGTKEDENGKKKRFPDKTYTDKDEDGLGVYVRLFMKNEPEPRVHEFLMREAQPRNSVLWATSPRRQIRYAAIRSAVNAEAPEILMGIPFDDDVSPSHVGPERALNITPPEKDRLFELLDSGEVPEQEPPATAKTNQPQAKEDAAEDKPSMTLRLPTGEVIPADGAGLSSFGTDWVAAFRDLKNSPRALMEHFTPALSDAAIAYDGDAEAIKKLEWLGEFARNLVELEGTK